ncbi:hypothetical protein AWB80_07064 [Caballeronia pedi]|uniref:Uncharacterized protein n=1 Tax=Caballeronia pedi TaxID=1777141 RepID=A0A158DKG4_9BURK|nr:hypothetical protein [Caballeronia pedi]SAK95129.1 hypothetical protein AWB80_07064 [Caballeronia pedi]
MEPSEESIARVQKLIEQAERLRVRTVAVPLKDLRIVLEVCHVAITQQISSTAKSSQRVIVPRCREVSAIRIIAKLSILLK